jgi:hypothetical protein
MSAQAISAAGPAPTPVPPCRPSRTRSRRLSAAEAAEATEPMDDGLGWSEPEIAELARLAPGLLPGRIMTCDPVGALVLTELGATAATYCASLLLAVARARSAGRLWPKPGDRVALRRWPDGPVTVEGVVA